MHGFRRLEGVAVRITTRTATDNTTQTATMEGLWVIEAACVPALATALRETLARVAQARSVDANCNDAMATIYEYLSSPAFALRIRSAVETFIQMKDDLDGEALEQARRAARPAGREHGWDVR